MFRAAILLSCAWAADPEIVDRIAVSVGDQVITEGQILEEIRVASFLNHREPDFSGPQKRLAADRLIEQMLLKRDMQVSHYPSPPPSSADQAEAPVRASYPNDEAFQQDLRRCGITEEVLRRHLLWQATILRYIDYRFQPSVQIPEEDIQQYYAKQRAEWERQGLPRIPDLEESRAGIEKILTQQRVDQALDRWLGDARTGVDIEYRKEAFQ